MTDKLPSGKYFISHSYKDAGMRAKLIQSLPEYVEPFVFPEIKTSPVEFISTHLIDAILECEGLIYLNAEHSTRSFWVAFERDYALRAGLAVYEYRSGELIRRIGDAPLTLRGQLVYRGVHRPLANFIMKAMRERHFDVWVDTEHGAFASDTFFEQLGKALEDTFEQGGYVTVLWSPEYESRLKRRKNYFVWEEVRRALEQERLLVGVLEPDELPDWLDTELDTELMTVPLYDDGCLSVRNRVDDLIVRLYWLIYRNQQDIEFDWQDTND